MANAVPVKNPCNLFAAELSAILAARGNRLGQIDDRTTIHRAKVSRLMESAKKPVNFALLNPDQLQEVASVFHLTLDEETHLLAAILATSIQHTLADRIDQDNAYKAAVQILPIIEGTLKTAKLRGTSGLSAVRTGGLIEDDSENPVVPDNRASLDTLLDRALNLIDQATMAMYLSRTANATDEQINQARQAHDRFAAALYELERQKEDICEIDAAAWQMWHDEAQSGMQAAQKRLEMLQF